MMVRLVVMVRQGALGQEVAAVAQYLWRILVSSRFVPSYVRPDSCLWARRCIANQLLIRRVFDEIIIKVYKYTAMIFYCFLQREITFGMSCFLSWTMQPFQKRVFSLRKEFAPRGANSFL